MFHEVTFREIRLPTSGISWNLLQLHWFQKKIINAFETIKNIPKRVAVHLECMVFYQRCSIYILEHVIKLATVG